MKIKRIISILLLILIIIIGYGCSKFNLIIECPDIVYIDNPIYLSHNYKGNEEAIWTTSNHYIAYIDENNMIYGQACGEVEITLQIGEYIACKIITIENDNYDIYIKGTNNVEIGEKVKFTVVFPKGEKEDVEWSSYDSNIAIVDANGYVEGIDIGTTTIKAKISGSVALFEVNIISCEVKKIVISGNNKVPCGESIALTINCYSESINDDYVLLSSDESIAIISADGVVTGVKIGKVKITAYLVNDPSITSCFDIEVISGVPESIKINGDSIITQGQTTTLSVKVNGKEGNNNVIWKSLSPLIAIVKDGIVFGITEGKAKIICSSSIDDNIKDEITIEVKKYIAPKESIDDINRVNNIMNNMTLSQKIGQMFVVGFNGTTFSSSFGNIIEQYHFGNVIYMGNNVSDYNTITKMSNDIQEKMAESNNVPAFISIDQEGGKVARIKNGGTHFISNMAIAATNDYNNSYLEGIAIGNELYNYGINVNFAPVLDVNNNPNNPVIGVRSYSDNPINVSLYGNNLILGLKEANVMGCAKHFPGHGNTNVDSHYGLPIISSKLEDLYQTEIVPFMGAISNGIDCIMSAHIIFENIDSNNPATLSKDVLNGLLREKLGYTGLIITDGMEMSAVTNNFGGYDQTAIKAINAGADLLLYTTNTNPQLAYQAIYKAVNNGEISTERINESVQRILLKKLKNGILDDYNRDSLNIDNELLNRNEQLNNELAIKSLTLVKGTFDKIVKDDNILIISPLSNNTLSDNLESNSLGCFVTKYLQINGFKNCEYININNVITNSEYNNILIAIKKYNYVIYANSNINDNNEYAIKLVKLISSNCEKNLIIALDSPYDILSYGNENVKNYVAVYGYQKATTIAITKYLNNEFDASGILQLDKSNFE